MSDKIIEARRAAFESWLSGIEVSTRYDSPFKLDSDGCYFHNRINARWIAWNAALDSLCVEFPAEHGPAHVKARPFSTGFNCAIELCRSAIHAAGVKTK